MAISDFPPLAIVWWRPLFWYGLENIFGCPLYHNNLINNMIFSVWFHDQQYMIMHEIAWERLDCVVYLISIYPRFICVFVSISCAISLDSYHITNPKSYLQINTPKMQCIAFSWQLRSGLPLTRHLLIPVLWCQMACGKGRYHVILNNRKPRIATPLSGIIKLCARFSM